MADWLHIKADKSLPSHTVRTAVYQMLNQLPCETTHLKRNNGEHSKTIGMVVMELYKHKLETKDNKRVLRLLIEKWSRPIYKKNADARSAGFRENDDLKNARFEQGKEKIADSRAHDKSNDVDTALRSTVDSDAPKNEYNRAITPYSAGFIFTQRPEPKAGLHADKSHTSSMDSTREGLMKKMGAMKGVKGFGKKEVATTMDMAATGRNKFNI